jgi:hypothetical protein
VCELDLAGCSMTIRGTGGKYHHKQVENNAIDKPAG